MLVWGGAFLFLRISAPEVVAVLAAEVRIAIGGPGPGGHRRTADVVDRTDEPPRVDVVVITATFGAGLWVGTQLATAVRSDAVCGDPREGPLHGRVLQADQQDRQEDPVAAE